MTTISIPSVACICVTKNRPAYLRRSIEMFGSQDYFNKKLVIVCDSGDDQTICIAKENYIDPVIIPRDLSLTLGEIRNLIKNTVEADYICQWDDDDWFHAERLTTQMTLLFDFGQSACALTNWLIFDETTGKSYLSMYRLWEGSAIYNVSHAKNIEFPSQKLGEDTVFLNSYAKQYGILPATFPHLYIYRIHSGNSWAASKNHFDMMIAQSQLLPEDMCSLIKNLIDSPSHYMELCALLKSKELLSKLHFFKFNNLNYSNQELIEYMSRIDKFDKDHFCKMIKVQGL